MSPRVNQKRAATYGFGSTQASARLVEFAYLERACAHILAGWIVKTHDLGIKVAWGRELASDLDHASRLRDRARALRAGVNDDPMVSANWREALRRIDESKGTAGVVRGIFEVKQHLANDYAKYLEGADSLADAASITIVESAHRATQEQIRWATKTLRRINHSNGHEGPIHAANGGKLSLEQKSKGTFIPFGQALWEPLDRVPHVARPAQMQRGEAGALRRLPIRPRARKDTGLFLHNFLNEEFATLELIARNSYEHPEMPWAFHRDAARHAGDEARHAQMFIRTLPEYGVEFGDYPVYTYSYEGEYEFPPCEPGSQRELLWRILLRQVVHEGLALDSTAFEIRKREYLRQPKLAQLFGYILADEVFHAGAGVKWARYLVNNDEAAFVRERDEAYTYYAERLKDRRLTWGATHIAEAAAEAEQLEEMARHHHFPFKRDVNVVARKMAGFSDAEIEKIKLLG